MLQRVLCFLLLVSPLFPQTTTTTQPGSGGGGGAPAFNTVTPGTNTVALVEGTNGSFTPSTTGIPQPLGQIAADSFWLPFAPAAVVPPIPTLVGALTGGTLSPAQLMYVKLTYVGLGTTVPSAEAKLVLSAATNCGSGSSCTVTVNMPASCQGSLPAGATGCTVWDANGSGIEKQQTALAACVNITTATCVIGTFATGSTLVTPTTTGVNPPNVQAVTNIPDNCVPNTFLQKGDLNYYPVGCTDMSALNVLVPLFANGTYTWFDRWIFADKTPSITNTLVSIDHESGQTTGTGTAIDDRALTIYMHNEATVTPTYEQDLGEYGENHINSNSTICGPIGLESCVAMERAIVSDDRTSGTLAGGLLGVDGVVGGVFNNGSATTPVTGVGYVGVVGFAQNSSVSGAAGQQYNGVLGTTNNSFGTAGGLGYNFYSKKYTTRFGTFNVGYYAEAEGASDWNIYSDGYTVPLNARNFFAGNTYVPALLTSKSTINVTGSLAATGSISTAPLAAPLTGTISVTGTNNSATWSYVLTALDGNNKETTVSPTLTTVAGASTLTGGNFNTVCVGNNNEAANLDLGVSKWNIRRITSGGTPSTLGIIGTLTPDQQGGLNPSGSSLCLNDTGLAGDTTASPAVNLTGAVQAPLYLTTTNCAVNSASPAACSAAAAGAVVVPTTTATYTVNTTAVTAASRIFLMPMTFAGNLPSAPTCVTPAVTSVATISAISAGVSFTFALPSTTGQTCWEYSIVN